MRFRPSAHFVACLVLLGFTPTPGVAQADAALDALYARIAADLREGEPLRVRIYVALCDNDSQGIVPVKNPAICDGEHPERNIYWATSGGLQGYLDGKGWRRLAYDHAVDAQQAVLIRARWSKQLPVGARLRALGVRGPVRVEIEGLAYRGRRIRAAMTELLAEVHGAEGTPAPAHLVGYIGHDYFLDTNDDLRPWNASRDDAALARGVFALSCYGEQSIRPSITRAQAPVLLLNRGLTYPGAWSVGGLIEGIVEGRDGRGIHALATEHFAAGKRKPAGALRGVFSYGSTR